MTIANIWQKTQKKVVDNSPSLLAGLGVTGTLSTAYLVGKATVSAVQVLEHKHQTTAQDLEFRKEDIKTVWKLYIPAAASGVLTIACIIGGNRIGAKRAAAAYSLLTVSERAFDEYRDKVVETIGEKKEQAVRDDIARDRMARDSTQGLVIIGAGTVLCYEMHTGRYFNSDMEILRAAQNTINEQLYNENAATLDDFYHLVGLPNTSYSSQTGWKVEKMLKLSFFPLMSDDNRPCIAFDYNYVTTYH